MKDKKIAEIYFSQRENKLLDVILIGLTVIGCILLFLWIFFYVGIGFLGFPLLIIGGAGIVLSNGSKITDEDFDKEVKRIINLIGIEENNTTLKEYIIGKSEHLKIGKDKKIRTAYYYVSVFSFKKDNCNLKKYVVDIFNESIVTSEHNFKLGVTYELIEKTYKTRIGNITKDFLTFDNDADTTIPVDIKTYDTDDIIKRVTQKR